MGVRGDAKAATTLRRGVLFFAVVSASLAACDRAGSAPITANTIVSTGSVATTLRKRVLLELRTAGVNG